MTRLLTLMMIVILVIAHGPSVAAAICRHQSAREHLAALQSQDAKISAVAIGEEAAGSVASKKGALADGDSVSWSSDMLPGPKLNVPFRPTEPLERGPTKARMLVGASVRPLLEPPAA